MKIVIIGGVAGGATTVTRLRRLKEDAQIIMIERGKHISFANCGLPYYIGDVIQEKQDLLLQTPESFKERFNVDVRVCQEVIQINRKEKKVIIRKLQNQENLKKESKENSKETLKKNSEEIYEETYDKLVISTGAEPINPYKNVETDQIKTLRSVEDAVEIKKIIKGRNLKHVTIIGGGYIGVEMAENLKHYQDISVTIVEKSSHLIGPLDQDMASFVQKKLQKHAIQLFLNNSVTEIQTKPVIKQENKKTLQKEWKESNHFITKHNLTLYLANNQTIETDFVILCIGVKPESVLAKECGLETNPRGSILVNEFMQTNDADIYALGDAVAVTNYVTKQQAYIPLAGPANRQARVVADHINAIENAKEARGETTNQEKNNERKQDFNKQTTYQGTIGSSILKVFDSNLGITGINEQTCKDYNIPYKVMLISPYSHATYYPGATQMTIKALYEPERGKILGAQIWGRDAVDKITDILATAIKMHMTAYDLEELELSYAPPFSSAKSPINILGNAIENELHHLVKTITWQEVEKIENPYILDVRTKEEYEHSHLPSAILIPLDELRKRLNELDKTKTILVHCHTGLRSYIACRILSQNGFQCKNIMGGYYFYKNTTIFNK